MKLEIGDAAAERTEAARRLIKEAQQDDLVELVTVSGLELCVLGGPEQPLFDEAIAQAWLRLGNRRRKKVMAWITDGMAGRGLLTANTPGTGPQRGAAYSVSPELGIMLAARCQPASIVLGDMAGVRLRSLRLFTLGDQGDPVRGIVVEIPTKLPAEIAGDFPHVPKLGPLGWFYRYVLASRKKAGGILAEVAIHPAPIRPGVPENAPYVVSRYHPRDGSGPVGFRLSVRGDGTWAQVDVPGTGAGIQDSCDLGGLSEIMMDLVTAEPR